MRWLIINENSLLQYGDSYFTKRQWPHFGVRLASMTGGGTLLAPVAKLTSMPDHRYTRLSLENATIKDAPWEGGYLYEATHRLFHSRRWRQQISDHVMRNDVVLHRGPSPYLQYVAEACRRLVKPLVVLVSGDLIKAAKLLHTLPRVITPFARSYLQWKDKQQIAIGREAIAVFLCGGTDLAAQWKNSRNLIFWRTGHLTADMFYLRQDTCEREDIRLIRVCDLSGPRGVEVLLEAFAILASGSPTMFLDIVGSGKPAYESKLRKLAETFKIADRVVWHGWCNTEKVQMLMRQADIQVISSLADGVPRVILEGAATGLPLVASEVGGIPLHVHHEKSGLLIPPGNVKLMVEGIHRMIQDKELRREIICQGYHDARQWTLDSTVTRMVDLIYQYI